MQTIDLRYKEIYPKIFVYSNLFPDHKNLHSTMQRSENQSQGKGMYSKWTDWFIFGRYCSSRSYKFAIEDMKQSFKDGIEYDFDLYEEELLLHNRLNEAVTAAICSYVSINNITLPENSYISDQNIARYDPGVDSGEGKTMQYHTDYGIGEWYWPGEKFLLTATTYMNDDYEGGELMFSIGDEVIKYKPKAGEVVVFPSGSPLYPGGEPYFHAVAGIRNSSKSLVRMYLKHTANGEKKWYDGEEKYGKDKWYEIAKKRAEGHSSIAVFDNEPRLCSALITKLYGIDPDTYETKENVFYDEDEIQ